MSGERLARKATSVRISSLGYFSEEVGQQLSEEGDLDATGINRACWRCSLSGVMVKLNSPLQFLHREVKSQRTKQARSNLCTGQSKRWQMHSHALSFPSEMAWS